MTVRKQPGLGPGGAEGRYRAPGHPSAPVVRSSRLPPGGAVARLGAALVCSTLLLAVAAGAQPATAPSPAPAAPPLAPLEAGTWAHGWFGGETVWTTGVERKVLAVGWAEGQVGFGPWGLAGTAGVLGTSGELKLDDPATFSAFRVQAALHRNLLATTFAACGVAGAVEYGVPLGTTPGAQLYHEVSAGAGLICSGSAWRMYVLAGQDMQMPGFGVVGYAAFPLSDRTAWVVRTALGTHQRYAITLDVVARVW